jgi:hypothetical protein
MYQQLTVELLHFQYLLQSFRLNFQQFLRRLLGHQDHDLNLQLLRRRLLRYGLKM